MRPICIGARLGGGPARPATSRPAEQEGDEDGGRGGGAVDGREGWGRSLAAAWRLQVHTEVQQTQPVGEQPQGTRCREVGGPDKWIRVLPKTTEQCTQQLTDGGARGRRRRRCPRRSHGRLYPQTITRRFYFPQVTQNPGRCSSAARHWPGRLSTSRYWRRRCPHERAAIVPAWLLLGRLEI